MSPMCLRLLPAALMLVCLPLSAQTSSDTDPATKAGQAEDVNDLSMEVAVLRTLNLLAVKSAAQLRNLEKLAKTTAQKPRIRKAEASAKYKKTLADLHDALVKGDDEAINKLEDQLAELKKNEEPDLDDEVQMTDEGRKQAPAALRLFRTYQVARYLAAEEEQLPDPRDSLLRGLRLEKSKKLKESEWKELRDSVAEEVGWLMAGFDDVKAKPIREAAAKLLDRANELSFEERQKARPQLLREASQLVGDANPMDVCRHIMERDLAFLLSNPRLGAALEAKLNAKK